MDIPNNAVFVLALVVAVAAAIAALRGRSSAASVFTRDDLRDTVRSVAEEVFRQKDADADESLRQHTEAIHSVLAPLHIGLQGLERANHAFTSGQSALEKELEELRKQQDRVSQEAHRLSEALKSPTVRGRWGELTLENCFASAGMTEHIDYQLQTAMGVTDNADRPDAIVKLPGGRSIAVDVKASMARYLEAEGEADENRRTQLLREHAAAVRQRARELARKEYWATLGTRQPGSPEYVVLLVPGENFFQAALHADPQLIEFANSERVIIASPTTLIGVLRSAAMAWQQARLTEGAEEVRRLGAQLFGRLNGFGKSFAVAGVNLTRAVEAYNNSVATFDTRIMVTARRMRELGGFGGDEIAVPDVITSAVRLPHGSTEMAGPLNSDDRARPTREGPASLPS